MTVQLETAPMALSSPEVTDREGSRTEMLRANIPVVIDYKHPMIGRGDMEHQIGVDASLVAIVRAGDKGPRGERLGSETFWVLDRGSDAQQSRFAVATSTFKNMRGETTGYFADVIPDEPLVVDRVSVHEQSQVRLGNRVALDDGHFSITHDTHTGELTVTDLDSEYHTYVTTSSAEAYRGKHIAPETAATLGQQALLN